MQKFTISQIELKCATRKEIFRIIKGYFLKKPRINFGIKRIFLFRLILSMSRNCSRRGFIYCIFINEFEPD